MWYFRSPKNIVFGEDAISYLEDLEGKSVLLVTDSILMNLEIPQIVIKLLQKNNMNVTIFDEVNSEPTISMAEKGAKIASENEIDWIVAVGGGSVIDCAKSIWILYENPEMRIDEVFPEDPLPLRNKARLIAIPTTSGTGSDANWAVVITDTQTGQKLSLGHKNLIPDISIVDPQFTLNLPKHVTASTGIDVLAHSIEAYTIQWRNDFSNPFALQAIKTVFKYLPKAVEEGQNLKYREEMHNAATMAGIAIGNSQIGGAHALAHSAGAILNINHGNIIAVVLPYMMRFCVEEEEVARLYSEIAYHIHLSFSTPKEGALKLIDKTEELIRNLGLKMKLSDFGITKKQLEENMEKLCDFAINDTGSLVNPRDLTEDDIVKLYNEMF